MSAEYETEGQWHGYQKMPATEASRRTWDNVQLEIDRDRGVLWVHSPEGFTLLRVCGLPRPIVDTFGIDLYDVTIRTAIVTGMKQIEESAES